MPEIVIGARSVPYDVHRSPCVVRKRIEVSPAGVQVIVPVEATESEVEGFVERKRRWLHDKTEEIREELERLRSETPQGFHSGAKVLFRGRYLKVRIRTTDADQAALTYRTGFNVEVPRRVPPTEQESIARGLIESWLEERLAEDAWAVVRRRGSPHGLQPRGILIKRQRTLWGSCGRDGVIRLDSKLARVPKPVFEYVVVHELCHIAHRDHSPAFWNLLKRILPDYEERKTWLEAHEVSLG